MTGIIPALRPRYLAGALLVFMFGCGAGSRVHTADPGQAQEALRTMLDAWKAGGKPEDLENLPPPIYVKDVDWHEGFRLVSYEAAMEGKASGFDLNYPIVLELKSLKGKAIKRNAVYTITTRPLLLVLRQEG